MYWTDHSRFRKRHDFVPDCSHAERGTPTVLGITAVMIIEIVAGFMPHSMVLPADGWHMSTHFQSDSN
jgi:Co/Zn/Cd efflux system component